MKQNFEDLKKLLDNHHIPVVHPHFGFLEIIKKQTHENINSQLYAHFLECPISEVRSAFLMALIDLVFERTKKNLKIYAPTIIREKYTPKRNRIDIVVDDSARKTAIIIENKINHHVANDFVDYWDTYSDYPEANRVGVLLTKEKTEIPVEVYDYFVNITHTEWINKVERLLDLNQIPGNYKVYFQDFINTIKNFSKMYDMNESARFYFRNAKQLLKAEESIKQAHNFINAQMDFVATELGWETYGTDVNWRNIWDGHNSIHIYFTVLTENLVKGEMEFTIILELFDDIIKSKDELTELLRNNEKFDLNYLPVAHTQHHMHFQRKDYRIAEEDLERLGEIILTKIREDFADITLRAIKHIYPGANISAWESKLLGEV